MIRINNIDNVLIEWMEELSISEISLEKRKLLQKIAF